MTCQLHALPGRKAGEDLAPRFFDLLFNLSCLLLEADAQGMGLRMLSEFLEFALQFHDRFLEIKIVFHSRRQRLMVQTLARRASDHSQDCMQQPSARPCLPPFPASLRESSNRERQTPKLGLSAISLVIQGF